MTPIARHLTDEEIEARNRKIHEGRYAYVPVPSHDGDGYTLGIAVEGLEGYCKTDFPHSFPTMEEAMCWSDLCNERHGITKPEAIMIIRSTMKNFLEKMHHNN